MSDAMNIDKAMSAQVEAERPDWLEQWQQAGLETFRDTAWPTRKTEQWKYTPLKSLTGIEWSLAPEDRNAGAGVTFEDWDVIRLDIVNGIVQGNPDMPEGAEVGIRKGLYLLREGPEGHKKVQLMGSGAILRETRPATIIKSACRGDGRINSIPKREPS